MPDEPLPAPRSGLALIGRGLRRHRRALAAGYPLILCWQLCETLVPVVIGFVVDHGITTGDGRRLLESLLVLAVLFVVLASAYRFGSRFVMRSIETEAHLLRLEITGHVLHPRGARTDLLPGEVQALATSDAALVPTVFRQLAFTIASLTSVVVVAAYLVVVDVVVGLLVLLGVPAVLLLIQVISPLVARRTETQQERTARATGLAADLVQGLRPLKGIGGEGVALARYRTTSREAADATIGLARSWGYLGGLTAGLSTALLGAVTLVAGTAAIEGRITLGQLIAIVGLTQFLAEPIRALSDFSAQFAGSRAAAGRISRFLGTPRLVAVGDALPGSSATSVVLEAVDAGALRSFDLSTHDGEVLAVTVDDPAVGDALMGVLAGERPIEAGRARLGDADLAHLDLQARRATLTVAPHHATIDEGTLRSVIDPDGTMTPQDLDLVLQASAAQDVVALHEEGLDRRIRAEGSTLSGGQRQRLGLARALALDSPVLVLHDPTSAVDAVTEHAVAEGLVRMRRRDGRSTIVLTSSPALLQAADRVAVVRDGRVALVGTHAELLADTDYHRAVLR
ncbi:ABC transporter ATP-binding protein [Aeromicrobium sp.]|uniref:ABC transporter ATP-binding protein n=1 Tax=Aeromicrobium sp. TaxID=1871063 RepID=UPI0028B12E37|nr:ABC transporter ATP-binding protein [Aeromicrobium sp.]